MNNILSKKTGMWLTIGGGITLIISVVTDLVSLVPIYSMVGCVDTANCNTSSLDKRATIVHVASWFIWAAIAVMMAGATILLVANAKKEISDKK